MVASEALPLIKTGGLADVVGALPAALATHGVSARLLCPAYRGVEAKVDARRDQARPLGDPLGVGEAALVPFSAGTLHGWLLDCPALFDRDGGPYLSPAGHDWDDNAVRFALLSRVAAQMATIEAMTGWRVDVVHAHDWQAGLVGAYLAAFGGVRPPLVFTIHNLQFLGRFAAAILPSLALPWWMNSMHGLEFYGEVAFLKGGVFFADAVTTVSPTYAQEIQTPLGGVGLQGLLAARADDLHGIVNGIDDAAWNPTGDPLIAAPYSAEDRTGKTACKRALQKELGLEVGDRPLLGSVGRMTGQKGIDLVLQSLPRLLHAGAQLAILGSGEAPLELAARAAAQGNPGQVAFVQGYHEALSHRVIAGSDALLVPSRFEPCGLTQQYAQRYGTIPVVRHTGGLADTVRDADADPEQGTGFSFAAPDAGALSEALDRTLACLHDAPRKHALVRRIMGLDRGWSNAAQPYVALYRALTAA